MCRKYPLLLVLLSTACTGFDDPVTDDVGEAAICDDVATWEREWSELEADLAAEIGQLRGGGGECGDRVFDGGQIVPVHVPALRCAARIHARDMGERGVLSHQGSDGSDVVERITAAGYEGVPRGQLIAAGELDPAAVVQSWMADDGQCEALFDRRLKDIGVGLWREGPSEHPYWVLTFGTPPP
jgi:hypothetical protein